MYGAAFTTKKYSTGECGAISSTWGGGHRIDLAVGSKVIEIIKKERLLKNAERMGNYMKKEVRGAYGKVLRADC